MTEEQNGEFLKFGCLSRAIMKVCGQASIKEFCSAYEKWFDPRHYGMPRWDKVDDICDDLGYKKIADEFDYAQVLKRFEDGNGVIVVSHISLNGDDTSVLNHASVLQQADADGFWLWMTSQDGSEGFLPRFEQRRWAEKKCHGLSIEPKADGG